jgi:hypothetical protein
MMKCGALGHRVATMVFVGWLTLSVAVLRAGEKNTLKKATIDGTGEGWRAMTEDDFRNVNG